MGIDPTTVDKAYSIKERFVRMLGNTLYTTARRKKAFYGAAPIETWDYEPTAGPRAARLRFRAGLDSDRLFNILTRSRMLMTRALFTNIPGWEPQGLNVDVDGDSIVIEVLFPDAMQVRQTYLDKDGEASLRAKDGTSAILGLTHDWEYTSIIYSGMDAHALFVGQTGSGKTTTLTTILTQLARNEQTRFAIIDGKGRGPESLESLRAMNGLVGPIAYTMEDAFAVTRYVSKEMERRDSRDACDHPFHLIIDEFHVYSSEPDFSRWLDDFGRRGRSKNMHMSLGTQRSDANVWGIAGKTLQGQCGNVVLHKLMYPNDVMTVTGSNYPPAHTLGAQGDAYFKSNRRGVERVQVALPTERDFSAATGNEPQGQWSDVPVSDGRFTCTQQMAAVYVAGINAENPNRGGRGTLQSLLEEIGEPEKANNTADELRDIGRVAYQRFEGALNELS